MLRQSKYYFYQNDLSCYISGGTLPRKTYLKKKLHFNYKMEKGNKELEV